MPAKVDNEKCDGCQSCVDSCPSEAIVMENEKAKVKEEDCIDCNACEDACTSGAIKVEA
jgi:NAD-dependent dihydropyrimidine dehydrogenase PreA subunit